MKDLYRRDVKLVRRVTLEEAKRVLAEAHLTIVRFPGTGTSPGFAAYEWVDDEGDIVGKAEVFPKRAGEPDVQVLSSWFRGPEAAGLLACYREKILRDWGKRGEDAPTDAA